MSICRERDSERVKVGDARASGSQRSGSVPGAGREVSARAGVRGLAVLLAVGVAAAPLNGQAAGQEDRSRVIWDTRTEVAAGGGFQGPWRMNESEWDYVDAPTVDLDGRGLARVAWVDQARKDIFFQSYDAEGEPLLPEPVAVSASPEVFSWLPRLRVAPGDPDRIYVLWQEIVFSGGTHGGEIFFARSTDGGRTFSDPENLSRTPAGAGKGRFTPGFWLNGSLDLATRPGGLVYVAWTEYEGRLWFRRSSNGGRSFSEPVLLASGDDGTPANGPSLAAGPGDTVRVAWGVGGDDDADLRLATSTDGGRSFEEPRPLLPGEGHSQAPKIAVGDRGTLHLAYGESPEGFLGRYHVRYARSRDGGRSFEGATTVSEPLPEGIESASFPGLELDAAGDPHLIWELFPDPGGRPRGVGYASSGDGGRSFSPPSVVPGTAPPEADMNASLQGLFLRKLAIGEGGAVALVHGTFSEGEASRIWLYRGRLAGR